jgi:tetratricopeptide (TPR) repeat protein
VPGPPAPGDHCQQTFSRSSDYLLVALVLLLAFLVASFAARNTDVWMHLAAGKLLVEGEYRLGAEPFSYALAGAVWVNHNWLFDLLAFGLFQVGGGAALVLVKALVIVWLAWVLLRCGLQKGAGLWLAAAATTLAVVAMCPWLALGPTCISYLFLGLTCLLLDRGTRIWNEQVHLGSSFGSAFLAAHGWTLALFVLWVNMDGWFLLGPLTVILFAAGHLANQTGNRVRAGGQAPGGPAGPGAALGVLAATGVLVCLVNPYHIHAFRLPVLLGLSELAQQLGEDFYVGGLILSPLQPEFFRSGLGLCTSGIAYWLLVVLGLASFVLSLPKKGTVPLKQGDSPLFWQGLFIWLAFFLLSLYQARTVPFFAVIAGPILARNLAQGATRWLARPQGRAGGLLGAMGRPLLVLACLALVVGAWPGWLLPGRGDRRQWTVQADPSLQWAAEQLGQWRQQGRLAEGDRGLSFSPDVAQVFAWFCPAERGFLDARLQVDPAAVADFLSVRQALERGAEAFPEQKESLQDVRAVLRRRHINHLILYSGDRGWFGLVAQRLLRQPVEWPLLFCRGRTLVFGWRDPEKRSGPDPFADLQLSLKERALHPGEEELAPRTGAGQDPEPLPWWEAFVRARAAWDPDRDEAATHLLNFRAQRPRFFLLNLGLHGLCQATHWIAFPACTAGTPTCAPVPVVFGTTMTAPASYYFAEQDEGPASSLLAAIRAARRSVHADPSNPSAQLILGEAYLLLLKGTKERVWRQTFPGLQELRAAQAVTALQAAVLLRPKLVEAHRHLVTLFEQLGFYDLALKHEKEVLEILRAEGPKKGHAAQFAQELAGLQEIVQAKETALEAILEGFDVSASNMREVDRAALAVRKKLGGKALETLLDYDVSAFGNKGLRLEIRLLLLTGKAPEARDWMQDWHKDALGSADYQWFQALAHAATGDYEEADKNLAAMVPHSHHLPGITRKATSLEGATGSLIGLTLMESIPGPKLRFVQWNFLAEFSPLYFSMRKEGVTLMLRGLLALEAGQTTQAEGHFRRAIHYLGEDAAFMGGGELQTARAIAQYWLNQLERPAQ